MKRREICAMVAGGMAVRDAARYVGCSYKTVRRELRRDTQFQEDLRYSETYAQLSPLRAMQKACATHWRAAAWMLERGFPNRFGRRERAAFGPRQARNLLSEVLDIFHSEFDDPLQMSRVEKRLRATFEYWIRDACDVGRTRRQLREAMEYFEEKNRLNDPLLRFGFPSFEYESSFKPRPAAPGGQSASKPAAAVAKTAAPTERGPASATNASSNTTRKTAPPAPEVTTVKTEAPVERRPANATTAPSNTTRTPARPAPAAVPRQPAAARKSAAKKNGRTGLPFGLQKSQLSELREFLKEFTNELKAEHQRAEARARQGAGAAASTPPAAPRSDPQESMANVGSASEKS